MEVLRLTGFKTYTEFMNHTTLYEREFLTAAIGEWHEERGGSFGGGL